MLVKGFIMGLVFGIPAGAIGVLAAERTIKRGFLSGFVTGLGSSASDLVYSVLCLFGMGLLPIWEGPYGMAMQKIGAVLIIAFGLLSLCSKSKTAPADESQRSLFLLTDFASSFLTAVMNPAVIASFFAAFAAFEITGRESASEKISLIAGIFLGTVLWWLVLSAGVNGFRKRMGEKMFVILRKCLGTVLILFGMILFLK